jgi:ankyrin repeat protein
MAGNVTEVRSLLEKGADPMVPGLYGYNALHEAAFRGNRDLVELLMKESVDLTKTSDLGTTPAEVASIEGYEEIHRLINAEILSRDIRWSENRSLWCQAIARAMNPHEGKDP